MSPQRIVAEARQAGLDLIAICDHNAAENGLYVRQVARGNPVVIPGIEIQTEEEVEVLAYFADVENCLALAEELYALLPDVPCPPELFGDQLVVDETGEIVRRVDRLLLTPVPLPLMEVVRRVEARGGLAIPAHVDRLPGGLLAVLGLFPEGEWPAAEIAPWTALDEAGKCWPELRSRRIFRSSDAHVPEEIDRAWTDLYLLAPTFEELRAAVSGTGGRRVCSSPEAREQP